MMISTMETSPDLIRRGRSLVRAGLTSIVVAWAAMPLLQMAMSPGSSTLAPVGRALIVLLLAVLMDRGRGWARMAMGFFALLGALGGVVAAMAAPSSAVALLFGGCVLLANAGGYAMAAFPRASRAYTSFRQAGDAGAAAAGTHG
jgi:CDP-diglyceride synthetase